MKKTWKRLCTGFLALATVVTALPTTPVHAESKQYWTESAERVGIIEKVMNDGSIGSTFNEGYMKVEGETAYCIDINTDFKQFFQKRIKGRGYCDVGTSVISEFYTPLVSKGHDFLQTIGSLAQARQDGTATCEAKGDGTD